MRKNRNLNKKKIIVLFVAIFVMMTLTACKGDKIENKDTVSCNYEKRIEEIQIKNETEKPIYVDFEVLLLDKDGEIRYKEEYSGKSLSSRGVFSVDLEDIKPEYVEYDKVNSMDIEVLEIYECDEWKECILAVIFILAVILIVVITT